MKYISLTLSSKIILVSVICSITSVLVLLTITPKIVENRFIELSQSSHVQNFMALLERYEEFADESTPSSAIAFNETLITPAALELPQQASKPNKQGRPQTRPMQGDPRGSPEQTQRPDMGLGRDQISNAQIDNNEPNTMPDLRFVIADKQGIIILPFAEYDAGQQLTPVQIASANEIESNGEILGYALSTGDILLSEQDRQYLTFINQALLYAGLISIAVALILSYLITRNIRHRLNKLIIATKQLSEQKLPVQIPVTGVDELSILSKEFNAMSYKLTTQYHQLKHSHETIQGQSEVLKRLSVTDELTQLFNRRYFNEALDSLMQECKSSEKELSLVMCDIDKFKQVNDNFSHLTGDSVLKHVAKLITAITRDKDVVARFGGEEIVIIMPYVPKHIAYEVAERIRKSLEDHDWNEIAIGLNITISMGVASLENNETVQELLAHADSLLYQAKDEGRNRVCK